jgi:hypothetical protein
VQPEVFGAEAEPGREGGRDLLFPRAVIAAGMLVSADGLAWYAVMLTPTSNYYTVFLPALLASGIGAGLTFVGCTSLGMRASRRVTPASRPARSTPVSSAMPRSASVRSPPSLQR